MSGETTDEERFWEAGFEGHAEAQMRRLGRLPLSERLAWLEEAQRLAARIAAARKAAASDAE